MTRNQWIFCAGVAAACLMTHDALAVRINPTNVVAYAGQPFGVGRITIAPPIGAADSGLDREAFELREAQGRTLYPVFSTGPVIRFVRNLLGRGNYREGDPIEVWFLFRGAEPLDLELLAFRTHQFRVTPIIRGGAYQAELLRWWRAYTQNAERRLKVSDYPPLVEVYLTNMLAPRVGQVAAELLKPPRAESTRSVLDVLAFPEHHHLQAVQAIMRGTAISRGPLQCDLPADISWEALPLPPTDASTPPDAGTVEADGYETLPSPNQNAVNIEGIARHVPRECFYVRFGSFANFRWFRRALAVHGGDLARTVTLRAHDNGANQRLEEQLAIKESALAELLGGQVISDVALIGRDLLLQEGAAVGVLFETRLPLLAQDIQRQRREALEKYRDAGVEEQKIFLGGKEVSLLSTPDNQLRSYYVQDGKYHLVTTSRWMAEHFLLTNQNQTSLADTAEFHAIRELHPPNPEDTAWIYLSTYFLQGLLSPQYQIELQRRMLALGEMEVLLLAREAARAEQLESTDVAALRQARLLPPAFGNRTDGSSVTMTSPMGVDSLRGRRGCFTPIPDVPIEQVASEEFAWYGARAAAMRQEWRRLDPAMIAVQRKSTQAADRDELHVRVRMLPFQRAKFSPWIDMLGAPTSVAVQPAHDDILFAELVLRTDRFNLHADDHHIFLGVKDQPPSRDIPAGRLLRAMRMFSEIPAYIGAWPKPGWLDVLPWVRHARPDGQGMIQLPSGLWRYQSPDGWSLVSLHREVLESTSQDLCVADVSEPAQLRFSAGDLSSSDLKAWTAAQEYQRAVQASEGNVRLLHTLSQQFRVPRAEAMNIARQLLNVRLICPLGGEYQLVTGDQGLLHWVSSAWNSAANPPYVPPLLTWFRGARGRVVVDGNTLDADIQLVVKESSQ